MTPMSTSDARKRLTESIARLDQRDRFHREWLRAMDETCPPTEPRDQERDMTSPKISHRDEADHWYHVKLTPEVAEREKRHEKVVANALLAIHDDVRRIADALTRDNLHRLLAEESAAERRDEPVDTAPDVDPDEALARVLWKADPNGHYSWEGTSLDTKSDYLTMARVAREHIEAERQCPAFDGDGRCVLYRGHPGDHGIEGSISYDEMRARAEEAEGYYRVERARAEKAEADVERHSKSADKWCNLYADKCEEVESLTRRADGYRTEALQYGRAALNRAKERDALRAGIAEILTASRDMQADTRSSVTLAYVQEALDDLLNPTEGETDDR